MSWTLYWISLLVILHDGTQFLPSQGVNYLPVISRRDTTEAPTVKPVNMLRQTGKLPVISQPWAEYSIETMDCNGIIEYLVEMQQKGTQICNRILGIINLEISEMEYIPLYMIKIRGEIMNIAGNINSKMNLYMFLDNQIKSDTFIYGHMHKLLQTSFGEDIIYRELGFIFNMTNNIHQQRVLFRQNCMNSSEGIALHNYHRLLDHVGITWDEISTFTQRLPIKRTPYHWRSLLYSFPLLASSININTITYPNALALQDLELKYMLRMIRYSTTKHTLFEHFYRRRKTSLMLMFRDNFTRVYQPKDIEVFNTTELVQIIDSFQVLLDVYKIVHPYSKNIPNKGIASDLLGNIDGITKWYHIKGWIDVCIGLKGLPKLADVKALCDMMIQKTYYTQLIKMNLLI